MKADVSVSESDITKVKVGQPATVTVNALTNTKLAARVTHIAVLPTSSSSGTSSVVSYAATLTLTQRGPGLRPGMSATADVVTQQANDAITVPNAAITRAGPLQTVTVREPDGTTATKTVTTGLVGNSSTQVLTGLKAGGTVILPAVSAPAAAGTGSSASGAPGGFGGGFGGGGFPGGRPTGPPTGAFPGGGG
jgi:multidrug efflux pump subunit AcrA (membrane-fusion protein)